MKGSLPRTASLISLCVLLALASCRGGRALTGTEARRESREESSRAKDSVTLYVRDSVHVREKGDTVRVERWSIRYRDRWRERTDTVVIRDSVFRERPVATGKPLTGWQHFQLWCGRLALLLLACIVLAKLIKRRLNTLARW